MSDPAPPAAPAAPAALPSLFRSITANWLWYGVVVVSGFLLPRFIDSHEGRVPLGVWDFAWSLVVYVSFLAFGVTSAVNREVARCRARQDWTGLNRVVNASLVWLYGACAAGILLTAVLVRFVPLMLDEVSGDMAVTARLVVLLLGVKSALKVPMGVFNGIITGYERFDLLNAIRITRDAGALAVMAALLFSGFGLVALALTLVVAELAGEVCKVVVARRLCRTLRLSLRLATWPALRKVLGFGMKTFLQSLARGGIYQGSSLLVGIYLGPAALAVYARQRSLVMHLTRFVKQYAQVLVPRSSAMQAAGQDQALRELLVISSRYGMFIALPAVLVLVLLGDALLHVWMGPDYRAPLVLSAMALGHLVFLPHMGVYSILMGLGRHGIPALIEVVAASVSVLAGIVVLGILKGGLLAAALAMTVPLAIASGLVLPIYACRLVHLELGSYARGVLPRPILANLPLLGVLLACRRLVDDPLMLLLIAGGTGALVTAGVYYGLALPQRLRARIREMARRVPRQVPRREFVGENAT